MSMQTIRPRDVNLGLLALAMSNRGNKETVRQLLEEAERYVDEINVIEASLLDAATAWSVGSGCSLPAALFMTAFVANHLNVRAMEQLAASNKGGEAG